MASYPQSYPTVAPFTNSPAAQLPEAAPLKLAHGEQIKKVFEIGGKARGLGWLTGQLTVTDSRVVYRARAQHKFGSSFSAREMQIKDVGGVAFITRRGFTALSLLTLVIGTILAWMLIPTVFDMLGGLLRYGGGKGAYDLLNALSLLSRLAIIGIAVAIAIIRWKSTEVFFLLLGRDVNGTPVGFSGSFGRQNPGLMAIGVVMVGGPLLKFLRWIGVMDAEDAGDEADPVRIQAMYDEFGALILDLQNRGVLGTE